MYQIPDSPPLSSSSSPTTRTMAISPLLVVLSIAAAASAAASQIVARDGHGHHHSNAAPLLVLNETEVTMFHSPTPPSYFTIDWDDPDPQGARHPGLMIAHGLFMMLAFFVALPAGAFHVASVFRVSLGLSHLRVHRDRAAVSKARLAWSRSTCLLCLLRSWLRVQHALQKNDAEYVSVVDRSTPNYCTRSLTVRRLPPGTKVLCTADRATSSSSLRSAFPPLTYSISSDA